MATRRPMRPIAEKGVQIAPRTKIDKLRDKLDMAGTLCVYGLLFASYPLVMPCLKAYYWIKENL